MSNDSLVKSVITCAVQSVTKLNNLKAVKSENVKLKRDVKVKDEWSI